MINSDEATMYMLSLAHVNNGFAMPRGNTHGIDENAEPLRAEISSVIIFIMAIDLLNIGERILKRMSQSSSLWRINDDKIMIRLKNIRRAWALPVWRRLMAFAQTNNEHQLL